MRYAGLERNEHGYEQREKRVKYVFSDGSVFAGASFGGALRLAESVVVGLEIESAGDGFIVVWPGLACGRYEFDIWAVSETGEEERIMHGWYGVEPVVTLAPEEGGEEREAVIIVPDKLGKALRLRWRQTSVAEEAAAQAKDALESVREEVELLEGAREVIDKLHGEIASAVEINAEGDWVIGGENTHKPSRGARGENGLDADSVKRVEINSVAELPTDEEHTSGRYIYYVRTGTKATGWIENSGGAWPADIQLEINGVHVVAGRDEATLYEWADAINIAPCGVVASVEPTETSARIALEAEYAGEYGNHITLQADAWAVLSGETLTGGSNAHDIYVWGKSFTGQDEWLSLGNTSDYKIATDTLYGLVLLSSNEVSTLGAGIHKDSAGKIRVDDATTTRKGAVRLTALGSVADFEECVGNTAEKVVSGQNLGNGVGVRRATTALYGVVKLAAGVSSTDAGVTSASMVKAYVDDVVSGIHESVKEAVETEIMDSIDTKIQASVAEAVGALVPVGTIWNLACSAVPDGWMSCEGQTLTELDYPDLFEAIGITYGRGDELGTFKLPDFRDKVARGVDSTHTLGMTDDDALPNIEGTFGGFNSAGRTGAFTLADGSSPAASGLVNAKRVKFSAGDSNSVYGRSENVRTKAVFTKFIIKVQ